MGCGHSKINIYYKKSKTKNNSKKSVTPQKVESEEEEAIENESEIAENLEDCDQKKTIKVKPFGGPLFAQVEISTSQQDFFKMLDDKIENGPDYNSESESEMAAENARLHALLKDWETASAGSRSLPATPKKRPAIRSAEINNDNRMYTQIPQSVIHQSYGVTQSPYRPIPNYISQSTSHPLSAAYTSALQYQAISPLYTSQPTYHPPPRQYPSYNQFGSPIKTYASPPTNSSTGYATSNTPYATGYATSNSPRHIPYDNTGTYSPGHKMYGNGEMQYQQYKEAREQVLMQNQQPANYRSVQRNYQTSVAIPIVVKGKEMNRKQYELT